jgi:hypothetical protein
MEVSGEFDTPAALPRKKSRLCCWIGCLEGLRARLTNFGKVRLFSAYGESNHCNNCKADSEKSNKKSPNIYSSNDDFRFVLIILVIRIE